MLKDNNFDPGEYVYLIYARRFRSVTDRECVFNLFKSIFNYDAYQQEDTNLNIKYSLKHIQIGRSIFKFSDEIFSTSKQQRYLQENE